MNVLLIYIWSDLFTVPTGANNRARGLIDVLCNNQNIHQIHILYPCKEDLKSIELDPKIVIHDLTEAPFNRNAAEYNIKSDNEFFTYMFNGWARNEPTYEFVKTIVMENHLDSIFCCYQFYLSALRSMFPDLPIVCDVYDLLSSRLYDRETDWEREIILKNSTMQITASYDDYLLIGSEISTNLFVPHLTRVGIQTEVPKKRKTISCLYFGSTYYPNVRALELLDELAGRLIENQFIDFHACGPVTQKVRLQNTIDHGLLPSDGFSKIVHNSDIFICMEDGGTGLSTKVIDAICADCVIIGFPSSIRGLPENIADKIIQVDSIDGAEKALRALTDADKDMSITNYKVNRGWTQSDKNIFHSESISLSINHCINQCLLTT